MTEAHPDELFVVDEDPEQIKKGTPRPPIWRGLTVYYQDMEKPATRKSRSTTTTEPVHLSMNGKVYQLNVED
eukprot:15583278-Heterocapsa_arctica.AAC.1